jgi:DNA-binding transcriptional regulator YiaG
MAAPERSGRVGMALKLLAVVEKHGLEALV